MKKLLVLGVGNILLMDEGIGVHAVREIWDKEWPENVEFLDGGTFTQDLFYVFEKYEYILVLDVIRAGNEPGTIYRVEEKDLVENEKQALSLHDIDLLDSLRMASLLGNRPGLTVIGIEPEKIDWGTEMTPTLKDRFPFFVEKSEAEIKAIISSWEKEA
ncbi:MAG: HyaD/HybD family hydrogenase maturation endopeptidase [Desulfovibrionales bacterium]